MDQLSATAPAVSISIFALFVSLCLFFIASLTTGKKRAGGHAKMAPQAGGSWPLLGHLHLLGGPKPAHLVLAHMADQFGPIFTVNMGIHRAVVANTWEVAKECLATNDLAFATRPKAVGSELLAYNYAMIGQTPYGPYWRKIRKILTLHLLSQHQTGLLRPVRESEVLVSVRGVFEQYQRMNMGGDGTAKPVPVDMKKWFGDIMLNMTFRMIVGKRFDDEDQRDVKAREALREFFDLAGRFVVSDGLPFLRWLDLGGHVKAMKKSAVELDQTVRGWLDEHKVWRKQQSQLAAGGSDHRDFMDVMLSIIEAGKLDDDMQSYDADTIIKANCTALVLAATDTTTVTLVWALSLLLNKKEVLEKAQQELDNVIGKDRPVEESDLKNLPYLQAVIKETMRLYPAGPLLIPHEAIEDCTVLGYFIPKGTQLLVNIHKIHRDPRVWPEPSEFRPERFLTTHKDIDVRGQNFELLPFGSGRRMCPGISLALQVLGLSLGSFLHAFEVTTPRDEAVDMEEAMGLTNLKASPLDVLVAPRIEEHVYR